MNNFSAPQNWPRWFDPRGRKVGSWAFILNRITALGLTVYLLMHLVVLGKLSQGAEAYDSFIILAKTPVIKFGEMLVIAAGIIHGLNGIRIAITSFGSGARYHRQLFWGLMVVALFAILLFAYKMFFEP